MVREISAGGVVLRNKEGEWWMAAIELPADESPAGQLSNPGTPKPGLNPGSDKPETAKLVAAPKRAPRKKPKNVLCLPKGLVDPGEKALEAALREVREETGITAEPVAKLADIKYVYVRSWGDGERVFKIVSFYLLRYEAGRIDNIAEEMRVEVARARWVRLADAPKLLAYRGEKQMARKALQYLEEHDGL
jgi:8-oxo-dGTP pyrophosphatase MutT (NUDIX family)